MPQSQLLDSLSDSESVFRFLSRIAGLAACSLLSGCLPYWGHYQRVEAPEAVYYRSHCGGFGPRDYAYYPYHGIFISVKLSPLQLGLHYTPETTVALDGDTVTIRGMRQNEPVELVKQLNPADHGTLGNGTPGEFCAMSDPMDPERRFGYWCPAHGPVLTWSYFVARDISAPHHIVFSPMDLEGMTITIPAMTINGQAYKSQELTIEEKKFASVEPINC